MAPVNQSVAPYATALRYPVAPPASVVYAEPEDEVADEVAVEEETEDVAYSEPEGEVANADAPSEQPAVARHEANDPYVIQDENGASSAVAVLTVVPAEEEVFAAAEPEAEDVVAEGPDDVDLASGQDDGAPVDDADGLVPARTRARPPTTKMASSTPRRTRTWRRMR